MYQGLDSALIARKMYEAAPNIDPTPLIGRLDSAVNPSSMAFGQGLKMPSGIPGTDLTVPGAVRPELGLTVPPANQVGLGAPGPEGSLNAMGPAGPAAGAGLLAGGIGMLQQAQPQQQHFPDFQVQYPGGQPARFMLGMPQPPVSNIAPSLSDLFARIRNG